MTRSKLLSLLICLPLLASCSTKTLFEGKMVQEAKVTDRTKAGELLMSLPPAAQKVSVALYDFQDLTGQFKNNEKFTDYSSAVTKGGHAILTKALLDAGNRGWFTVTERGGLKDLLQERQIIKVMRDTYQSPDGSKLPELPPLIYSGMLIQGGIVSYDSNVITGGAGAVYLGINASAQYHRDVVTVYLRAVNIQTGEVLLSVTSSKTIFSTLVDSNILKYLTFDRLLQAEIGFSVNEPVQLGVRQAIEAGVYSLIMEGAADGLWDFKDPVAGQKAVNDYMVRRDGKNAKPVSLPGTQPAPAQPQQMPEPQVQQQPAPQPEPLPAPVAQPEPQPQQQQAPQAQPAPQPEPAPQQQQPAPQAQPAPQGVPENAIKRWKPGQDRVQIPPTANYVGNKPTNP